MSIFEIIMLICFGAAWPFSIYRSAKARSTKGKSLLFMLVVATGYVAGIANKLVYNFDGVVYLYVFDLVLVSTDIALFGPVRGLCYDGRTVSGKDALCSSQSTSHVPRCPKKSTSRAATRSWRSSWCCSRRR